MTKTICDAKEYYFIYHINILCLHKKIIIRTSYLLVHVHVVRIVNLHLKYLGKTHIPTYGGLDSLNRDNMYTYDLIHHIGFVLNSLYSDGSHNGTLIQMIQFQFHRLNRK